MKNLFVISAIIVVVLTVLTAIVRGRHNPVFSDEWQPAALKRNVDGHVPDNTTRLYRHRNNEARNRLPVDTVEREKTYRANTEKIHPTNVGGTNNPAIVSKKNPITSGRKTLTDTRKTTDTATGAKKNLTDTGKAMDPAIGRKKKQTDTRKAMDPPSIKNRKHSTTTTERINLSHRHGKTAGNQTTTTTDQIELRFLINTPKRKVPDCLNGQSRSADGQCRSIVIFEEN